MAQSATDELPPGFAETLQAETHAARIERLRVALRVGAMLYAVFYFLDLCVAWDFRGPFLAIRAGVVALSVTTLLLLRTRCGRRHVLVISLSILFVAACGISLMTTYLGGFRSDYYIGVLLVLFFVGLFMPWPLFVSIGFGAAVSGFYFFLNASLFGFSIQSVSAAFFFMATSVFMCLATIATDQTRRRDLALRLRLERANEDLKALDDAKSRFFANISHELRTPLMLVLGPLDTLAERLTDASSLELVRAISKSARRLLRQVNTLLDMSKIDAGRLRLHLMNADLGKLIRHLVEAANPYGERKRITIRTEGLEGVPESAFDVDKMEVVIANLLSNALKFTPEGGAIAVIASNTRDRILIEVEDTGIGIPEEELGRIFDRFHQVDDSASRAEEGTGLGLSLVRELVMLHGGTVNVRSVLGVGSTFAVELPIAPRDQNVERRKRARSPEDQVELPGAESVTAEALVRSSASNVLLADVEGPELTMIGAAALNGSEALRVLLVEDNDDLRNFVASGLAAHYRVETACDGEEGLAAAMRSRPDIVVTDVMMPRMDGYELCRRLRADRAFRSTSILLVTAKAGVDAMVEGLDAGADDYITKPFEIRELLARLRAQARSRAMERALGERESRLVAIGTMASSIVHDVRNSITSLLVQTEYAKTKLDDTCAPSDVVRDLASIEHVMVRLNRTLQEILDFARGGDLRLRGTTTTVEAFVGEVGDLLNQTFQHSQVAFIARTEGNVGAPVQFDVDRIHRVLENLLLNARNAVVSREEGRAIWLTARVTSNELHFVVDDNGPGISDAVLARLFAPFESAGNGGTGLGLTTVRNIIRAHGGEIEASARGPRGGARFHFWLPTHAAELSHAEGGLRDRVLHAEDDQPTAAADPSAS